MSELFRRDAVQHAIRRLNGTVILATPVAVKTLGVFFAGILFLAVGFAYSASYARKATVIGYLVPDQGMIRATSQTPGILREVLVKEGAVVKAGDHVAVLALSTETTTGNVGDVVSQSLKSEAQAAGAKSEAREAQLAVERDQSTTRLSRAEAELEQVDTQISLQEQQITIAREQLAIGEKVAKKQLLTRRELEARRAVALTAEQELAGQRRQRAVIERDIADIKARLASIPIEIKAARSEAQSADAVLNQQRAESEARRQQFVTAPVSGKVAAIPVTTGQTVVTGTTIAVIIPEGSTLEAELLAPSRSIGFVREGQSVALSLEAFPYQRFGTVAATVRSVSTTVLQPYEVSFEGAKISEPVFRIRVSLSRNTVRAYGQNISMQPGMQISAEIVFDRRSLLQWLFDPIYAVGQRA
jgi:membrane fusion protein